MNTTKKLTNSELASLSSQLSLLINAGITPAESVNIMLKDTSDPQGKEILTQILNLCNEGNYFHDALEQTGVFPHYMLHMIKIGEESGNLDDVMQNLTAYYEREENISDSLKNAVRYPLFMIGMMLIVIIVLLTKVLPIFNQVFVQLGTELSGIAKQLMAVGDGINAASTVIIILLVLAVILTLFLTKNDKGHQMMAHFLATAPFSRNFYLNIAYGRFASGLSMALSSGLDTFHSMDLLSDLIENTTMKEKIAKCKEQLQNGDSFPEALSSAEIFSNLYTRMVSVGFRTGTLDTVMKKISEQYEKETEKKLHSILSAVEPTLVIIFSMIVGLILLSVILPLIGIMSSIG